MVKTTNQGLLLANRHLLLIYGASLQQAGNGSIGDTTSNSSWQMKCPNIYQYQYD
jgi:hypothetical protein